jgi:hypothetical protein
MLDGTAKKERFAFRSAVSFFFLLTRGGRNHETNA